ncbi:MAG: glycosyl hydrolase [Kordiimonadaceae bacterium]|nr:glycosyl hydrolase [Kordiimonadaceae bacterium]MBO6567465.1 glycosyl hydrolase [Kordiimonadaceae bacterium]MBO6963321.1 glycosyl hydrolase [Kordiimonadaceae bacterium]
MKRLVTSALFASLLFAGAAQSQSGDSEKAEVFSSKTFSAMKMRNIGPAYMSGRIADIAVDQTDPSTWYVAVGSGGVWKTENNGTTWAPIFDDQAVYSTGDVTIAPSNPNIIWVGTGENNGGRHISFGDGVYKSLDGGKTWKNMGLGETEHVSDIIIHPTNPDVVWVAAQGPLWTGGGERGLYKTTDGGETWNLVLETADEWTGVTSLVADPRNPDRLYAATWSRQRTIGAYVGTGPGAGIFTTEDGGETWTELKTGLPTGNMGKIGLAISPMQPDVVYAGIEIDNREGGVYRSTNRGASWAKMSDEVGGGTGPHYYQELYADQHQFDRIYMMSNYSKVSDDGGKTWGPLGNDKKHVDDHAMAFHPTDPDFVLVGSDGGVYMSHDRMKNWQFISNLPVSQFYKVAADDAKPFYFVYGGTQDNSTQGGPSRTDNEQGIKNSEWFLTLFADGHQPATEPGNPDIMYSQWQQGNLARHDRKTGEVTYIRPQPRPGEPAERYNWDAPINVSAHDSARIYHASQRVWRSDDRGDSWTPISPDLTKDGNRMLDPMMGRTWSVEAGWDLLAMSNFHTIANFAESPVDENVLWAGTDDGLIQVTTDGGQNWNAIELDDIRGIPETAYVNDIRADLFDRETVYVALDNHKYGDYKPYLIKSTNLGRSWTSLADDLPEKHLVWRIVQDHVNKDLMFIGTEFGLFFTVDGGDKWVELEGGMPTISTRDVVIQRDEGDLVAGTFGRGIYILDDYSPLRSLDEDAFERDALLMAPGRPVKWYRESGLHSDSDGDSAYAAENPPHGATLTYYLKDSLQTAKDRRQAADKEIIDDGDFPTYPSWESIEAENEEAKPAVYLEIRDASGAFVNRVAAKAKKGLHRVTWDMTHASTGAVTTANDASGMMAVPGTYSATLMKREGGTVSQLAQPVSFELAAIREGALPGVDHATRAAFKGEVSAAMKQASATRASLRKLREELGLLRTALDRTPADTAALEATYESIRSEMETLVNELTGLRSRQGMGATPATVMSRLQYASSADWGSYGPTQQHREQFGYAMEGLDDITARTAALVEGRMQEFRAALAEAGAPWTPGAAIPGTN